MRDKIKDTLHVGYPNIGDEEGFYKKLKVIFENRWLTNHGEFVQEFERKLEQYLGVKHCITMCNGTVALEIAARALDLDGEVIIPSFTFVATAHALQWQQIQPVFCDIDPVSLCIDPNEIEKHITPKTSGIIGVHLYGSSCDTESLEEIGNRHGLKIMYDASHAFGCDFQGKKIGGFGDCEVFSFHATKVFNTFEGGAIATNSDKLAEKIRLMQNFGFEKMDKVVYIGTNGKMSEVNAAMGLTNLESLNDFIQINRRNYLAYKTQLKNIEGIQVLPYNNNSNYQYVVIKVDKSFPISRDHLMEYLHENNVRARRYFWPGCHNMEPYRSLYPYAGHQLQTTEQIAEQILVLPTGGAVDEEVVEYIADLIRLKAQ